MAPFMCPSVASWLELTRPKEFERLEQACKEALGFGTAEMEAEMEANETKVGLAELLSSFPRPCAVFPSIAGRPRMPGFMAGADQKDSFLEQLLSYNAELHQICGPVHEELRLLRQTARDGERFVLDELKRCKTRTMTLRRKGKVVLVKKWRPQYMLHFQGDPVKNDPAHNQPEKAEEEATVAGGLLAQEPVAPQGDPQAEAQYFQPEFAFFL